MKLLRILLLLFLPLLLHAQTETFDMISFQPPMGWKKNVTNFAVSYSKIENDLGTWCQVGIYKSVVTSGNPAMDFSNEWKALVRPDTYVDAVEPVPTSSPVNEWTYNMGRSNFKWQGKDSYVLLLNIAGHGMTVSIHISSNSNRYDGDVEGILKSIQPIDPSLSAQQSENNFSKPLTIVGVESVPTTSIRPADGSGTNSNAPTTIVMAAASPSTTPMIKITDAPGVHGIATATTNFDDGWVAQPFADYVKVVKQPVTVLLHYGIAIDDEMRAASDMASFFWDRLIAPRYRTNNLKVYQNEPYTYNKVYFVEGDATEVPTMKTCYVALRVLVNNGVASCVEIISPTSNAFQQAFPDQTKIESMVNYNKFAISPTDIVGTWEESTSSAVDLYNTVTGSYAGMNAVAATSSFNINGGGTYSSEHKGAYGMVGSMTTYDQKYNGKYTLTPWELTMTNRFKGKTDVFLCRFEAVRGGRILYLNDKSAPGIVYRLARVK